MRTYISYLIVGICTTIVHNEVFDFPNRDFSSSRLLKNMSYLIHEHFTTLLTSKKINVEEYPALIKRIENTRISLQENKSAEVNYSNLSFFIADSLAPYWVGTPWDFNGISKHPQEGNIACGYFVFGLLEDAGFKLNRIKLSQAASETAIKALLKEDYIKRFSKKSIEDFVESMINWGDGIYLVGLDYHIAIIQVHGNNCQMIHASVYHPGTVVIEDAEESLALIHTDYRIVGKLSNLDTYQDWLEGKYLGL